MNVSYLAFLETHLNYLVARLFALEGDERTEMIRSIKNVRNLLNVHEIKETKFIKEI
jgi:hypothetical protein